MRDRERNAGQWVGERTKGNRWDGEVGRREGRRGGRCFYCISFKSTWWTGGGDAAQVKKKMASLKVY